MQDKFFIDTNIFVYSFDSSDILKQKKSRALIAKAIETSLGITSFQVVGEFLSLASRKFAVPFSNEQLQEYIELISKTIKNGK